jgi:hypothetical protein
MDQVTVETTEQLRLTVHPQHPQHPLSVTTTSAVKARGPPTASATYVSGGSGTVLPRHLFPTAKMMGALMMKPL